MHLQITFTGEELTTFEVAKPVTIARLLAGEQPAGA